MVSIHQDATAERRIHPSAAVEPTLRERWAARSEALREAERILERIGNLRLLLAGLAVALIIWPLFSREGDAWWGLVPVALLFLALGKWHDRAFERRVSLSASTRFYRTALDGFEEKWRELPDDGADLSSIGREGSTYADDLDLFGPASLFQLLNRCGTAIGRKTLASWLTVPASKEEIARRQQAVSELALKLDFRERLLACSAGEGDSPIQDARLLSWAEGTAPLRLLPILSFLGVAQPAFLVASAASSFFFGWTPSLFVLAVLLHLLTLVATKRTIDVRAETLSGPDRALTRYASLIEAIERSDLASPLLRSLVGRLVSAQNGGMTASREIRSLRRLVNLLDARLNAFFSLSMGPLLMWDMNIVIRAERQRARIGRQLRGWLEGIAEIEALSSFAALLYERPDYTMPEIVEAGPVFRAEALAHPLIDRMRVVANDVALEGAGAVILLSGSNMSGKSTLLRSVGINIVLARAGAPVAARKITLSMMELTTSVRVVDSLASGTSHFYAEVKRLKLIVDAVSRSSVPIFYLLDEMLHGTNSHDRLVGALSIVRWLSAKGAVGIVTTHDLALARIETELPPGKARNMHFSDDVAEAEIRFDYRLRAGPVASSNALLLMRAAGIDIEFVSL